MSSFVSAYLMIRDYSFTSHNLKNTSVDTVFTNFGDVVDFDFLGTRDNHLFGTVKNGAVGNLGGPTAPAVIVDWRVRHRTGLHFMGYVEYWGLFSTFITDMLTGACR